MQTSVYPLWAALDLKSTFDALTNSGKFSPDENNRLEAEAAMKGSKLELKIQSILRNAAKLFSSLSLMHAWDTHITARVRHSTQYSRGVLKSSIQMLTTMTWLLILAFLINVIMVWSVVGKDRAMLATATDRRNNCKTGMDFLPRGTGALTRGEYSNKRLRIGVVCTDIYEQ